MRAKGRVERPEEQLAEPESRRPVRAMGLLLILQVAGLAGLGFYELTRVDWRSIDPDVVNPSQRLLEVVSYAVFVPPAVLMVLAAMGFLLLRRRGWLVAGVAQALCLAGCIQLYTVYEPFYVYPIMVYCILMILYLNSQSVRSAFGGRRRGSRSGGRRDV